MTPVMGLATATSSRAATAVKIEGAGKIFAGGVEALTPIDLEIPAGQFIAILGPSGCGKTTLLRMIAELERPTIGRISKGNACEIGYVFQDAHLLPWRNVLRNVTLPLELRGDGDGQARASAAESALIAVGLGDALRRYPAQLSGGMRMRVSLARAMVTNPNLLLLDEPFAALDEITRQRLDEQLRGLWASRKTTVVFVTHSIPEATYLAERVVVMSKRPGRIVLDHRVQLPQERPSALRGEPAFARETRVLYEALERGGA